MNKQCPYSQTIRDEVSGIEVMNLEYRAWHNGYSACMNTYGKIITELTNKLTAELKRLKQPVNSRN